MRALLAIDIVPPLAAVAIIVLLPDIPTPAKAGILLMAISPVPPLVPGKALSAGGEQAYVYGILAALSLLAIVTVPLLGAAVGHLYGSSAQFPVPVVARNILMGVLAPLIIGILIGRWLAPNWAHRFGPAISKVALIVLVVAFLPIVVVSWPRMIALVGDGTVLAIIALMVVITLAAHLLGPAEPGNKAALVFSATTRHPGIALALAGANHADPDVPAAVLLFLLVGLVALIPYKIFVRRAGKAAGTA